MLERVRTEERDIERRRRRRRYGDSRLDNERERERNIKHNTTHKLMKIETKQSSGHLLFQVVQTGNNVGRK